jgi:hypothetical protein
VLKISIRFLDDDDLLGNIEVDMQLAYCDLQQGRRSSRRLIRARFKGVKDINFDFRQKDPIEWDIIAISIEKNNKELAADEPYFIFKVLYPKLVEANGSWQKTEKEYELFLFQEAELEA